MMTTYKLTPALLAGKVLVPSSKSMGHRMIICAGLAEEDAVVDNIALSKDIEATNRCLSALGVSVEEAASLKEGRSAFLYRETEGKTRKEAGPTAANRDRPCGFSFPWARF